MTMREILVRNFDSTNSNPVLDLRDCRKCGMVNAMPIKNGDELIAELEPHPDGGFFQQLTDWIAFLKIIISILRYMIFKM